MSTTKTILTVRIYGGPHDGFHGGFAVTSESLARGVVTISGQEHTVRRLPESDGTEIYLVHASVLSLWP